MNHTIELGLLFLVALTAAWAGLHGDTLKTQLTRSWHAILHAMARGRG